LSDCRGSAWTASERVPLQLAQNVSEVWSMDFVSDSLANGRRPVRTDNEPEFTSRAFLGWINTHRIRHILIEPGRPMQNGYIESFNGQVQGRALRGQHCRDLASWQRSRRATVPCTNVPNEPSRDHPP
jgi:putative transposase